MGYRDSFGVAVSLHHPQRDRIRSGRKARLHQREKMEMKKKTISVADISKIPTMQEIAGMIAELEDLRAKQPKWHRCDKPNEDRLYDLPPESGTYFAQWETTWADGKTMRYCEPLEYDADYCDWPSLTNHAHVIQWCENPVPPEEKK